ncbi:MAG: response regulator transcription factor [Lachnospiraceae bacterium]|nr:response regulator transcription factor [Lachnospiraceae bacterium]
MISISVVDDDCQTIAKFTAILERYYGTGNYIQQDFTNGREFVESLSEGLPNIVFMDIEMDFMNGEDAVRKLREKDINECTFVVYVSSHTERLAPFFALHPFDFLVKPFKDKAVYEILDKINERMDKEKKTCTLIIDRKEVSIPVNDIMWIQSQGHRLEVKVSTSEVPLYCYGKLNDLYLELEAICDDFLRVHASYAVNRRYITKFMHNEVYLKDKVFPVSVRFRTEVTMKLHERL